MPQQIVPLLKIFFVCVEVAIVVVVTCFFIIEGFSGSIVTNAILLFLGASSLAMLIGVYFESRKQR